MFYLPQGYIDILNHELRHSNTKKLRLITKSNDIIFTQHGINKYNSQKFLSRIAEKVLHDLNSKNFACKKLQFNRSALKFSPTKQTRNSNNYNEYFIKFKIYPYENTAYIVIDELNIIAAFNNELTILKKDSILNKKSILEESQSMLLTLPEHYIQIPLKNWNNYNAFKDDIFNSIYDDIFSLMIKELRKLNLTKWNINLGSTNLDIENIVNDNIMLLSA
ncbi:hypothetical protein M2651_01260 [Clostridium sp. SYSU_GA19001]|uniref:hypothetical protein n=1 Tax=Clostridium caldaquaticum TaxID=2940653 RepID=UPI00207705EF|nr:hypothetical protein [Clostridium caldaquaticum]MCM8709648.1 hypothetical protein [Clostridium caldaquaticum]